MASPELESRHPLRAALFANLQNLLAARLDRLDWGEAQAIGQTIGRLAWMTANRDRERSLEHLAIAFPALSAEGCRKIGRASFLHLGALLTECLWLAERGPAEILRRVAIEGWEEIERARAARRPLVIVSGHCGNWELIHAALGARGLGMAVVARGLDEPGLHRSLLALRGRFGTTTIVRGDPRAPRELRRALRDTGALALLIDQDTKVEGAWVDFLGRPAWTPTGAAEIALRFGATVLPTFTERLADGSHRLRIEPALRLSTDPVAATQAMTDRIAEQIRSVPEQWVWMHRRWRTRPPERTRPKMQSTTTVILPEVEESPSAP